MACAARCYSARAAAEDGVADIVAMGVRDVGAASNGGAGVGSRARTLRLHAQAANVTCVMLRRFVEPAGHANNLSERRDASYGELHRTAGEGHIARARARRRRERDEIVAP